VVKTIAAVGGEIADSKGKKVPVDFTFHAAGSVLFDAVYVAGGKNAGSLKKLAPAILFINESYKHCKAIAGAGEGAEFVKFALGKAGLNIEKEGESIFTAKNGVLLAEGASDKNISSLPESFKKAVSIHRVWDRFKANEIAV
jgi:catalase